MPKLFLDFLRWGWILGATGVAVKWLCGFHWALGVPLAFSTKTKDKAVIESA